MNSDLGGVSLAGADLSGATLSRADAEVDPEGPLTLPPAATPEVLEAFAKAGVRERSALVAASAALLSGGLCEPAAASEAPRANGSYGIANFSLAKA